MSDKNDTEIMIDWLDRRIDYPAYGETFKECSYLLSTNLRVIENLKSFLLELFEEREKLTNVHTAGSALIEDIKRRYPNESLRCPYMVELERTLQDIK